jgi:DNA-binding CsgD family transcriptional regulator/tetratricopeptide (TPR) repeat protein
VVTSSTTPKGRFIGRQDELAILSGLSRMAALGHRQLVVVSGVAGIGKTTFAASAAAAAEEVGFQVVWGRCWPDGGAPPLWPWQKISAEIMGRRAAELLAEEPLGGPMEAERFGRFIALADRLAEACVEQPTMVVVDDIHAADPGAVLLARFLARTLDRDRLLLLLLRRPTSENDGAANQALMAELERDATTLTLRRFDRGEITELLAAHGSRGLDDGTIRTMERVTGGNPLVLTRLLALGCENGRVDQAEHAIAAAISLLPAPTRRILAIASALGPSTPILDVATVMGMSPDVVLDALGAAADAGVIEPGAEPGVCFSHELLRQAASATLPPSQRLDAHARAAELYRGDSRPDRLAQLARHALAAAVRSPADAALAVEACRDAAGAMRRGFDYEQAAELLAAAFELVDHRPSSLERATVLVEWAETVRACGRLSAARHLFDRAADDVRLVDEPILAARAAWGLAGLWVNEQRSAIDRQRTLSLERDALATLPDSELGLRVRLEIRLAAEEVYDGGPIAPVLAALTRAGRLDDPATLAEALSVAQNALLAPEHTAARLPLADQLIQVASVAGDGMLALLGLMWRTVALYQAGNPAAEASLAELRDRADVMACRSILYLARCMEVMRLIRAGRLDQAEAAAESCLELGTDVGDPDALAYYGGQLLTLRWLQGRDDEMFELINRVAGSVTLVSRHDFTFRAAAAVLSARAGRVDEARRALDALSRGGLNALTRGSTWLSGMVCIAEAAHTVGDAGRCQEVYSLLEPFAALPVMPAFAVTCLGSVERTLGLAAMTFGELSVATAHLERAIEANERLGNFPMTVLTRAELAGALVRRAAPDDLDRALDLLAQAASDAATMGMDRYAQTCDTRARNLEAGRHHLRRSELMQLRGQWPEAMVEARQARGLLSGQAPAGAALYRQAELHRLLGEFADAETAYQQSTQWGRSTQPGLAQLRLAQGFGDVAAAAIREASRDLHDRVNRSNLLVAGVEIFLAVGDPSAARTAAEELSDIADDLDTPLLRAMAAHAVGSVLLAEGEPQAARTCLGHACIAWHQLEAPYELARSRVVLAMACLQVGDGPAARKELGDARCTFEQLGAETDLAAVEQLCRKAAPTATSGLTEREVQVLSLVAAGKTNRAIADDLFISRKTVDRHLSNIFTKLGLSSRSAATAFLYEHELMSRSG